jgi:serine/threonine protein kinase
MAINRQTLLAQRYELLKMAGEGGMATVWRSLLHGAAGFCRPVAVKRLLPQLVANDDFIAMFVEEARVGSQLQHPNIVQIIDFDHDEAGRYFLVMEWIEGLDLNRYIKSFIKRGQTTSWPLMTAIAIESLRGLRAAHSRTDELGRVAPVIHRDVTPANILIGLDGVVKLTDFGLSRAMDRARMTHPSIVKGKLAYLAPELSYGNPATPQSDLFSVGVVLWEALAGKRLYQGQNDIEVFMAARKAEIPPIRDIRSDIPQELADALHRALAYHTKDRFPNAQQMLRALAQILRKQPMPTDSEQLGDSVAVARRALATLESDAATPPPIPAAGPAKPPHPAVVAGRIEDQDAPIPLTKKKNRN